METPQTSEKHQKHWTNLKLVLYIFGTFLLFFFALDMMVSSFQYLGKDVVETIIQTTSNPFNGLFIGLLITAMIQSSSTTTTMAVALMASGSLTIQSAVPIIMGANIGTTITSSLVSLAFINKKKEFSRAVAAGSYHCFFNLITAVILFPLEYYYGFLSSFSVDIAAYLGAEANVQEGNQSTAFLAVFDPLIFRIIQMVPNAFVLIVLSFVLVFSSVLLFRKVISDLLKAKSPEAFSKFFFQNALKSFSWGLLTTAAIRSSTVTTSVVVPIAAKKITNLRQAAPFIMGANIGTTITAFIASLVNSNPSHTLSIAIAHFLFNAIGVLIFFPLPFLRNVPIDLARGLGRLTRGYRLAGFVFLLLTFFFIPFSLIYFNQDTIEVKEMTYQRLVGNERTAFTILSTFNTRTESGSWKVYEGAYNSTQAPSVVYPVFYKNSSVFIGKNIFLFSKPGFCWDGEDEDGRYEACITKIELNQTVGKHAFDSVIVSEMVYQTDSLRKKISWAKAEKVLLTKQVWQGDSLVIEEKLMDLKVE